MEVALAESTRARGVQELQMEEETVQRSVREMKEKEVRKVIARKHAMLPNQALQSTDWNASGMSKISANTIVQLLRRAIRAQATPNNPHGTVNVDYLPILLATGDRNTRDGNVSEKLRNSFA